MSETITEEEVDWDNLHLKRINKIAKIYTGFKIVSQYETYCMISHGKYISVFNIEQWRWVNHMYFEQGDVMSIHRRSSAYDVVLFNGYIY